MAETITGIGEYDHLNSDQPIEVGDGLVITDLDAFAKNVITANWGVHRMLSSLVRAMEKSQKEGDRFGQDGDRFGQVPEALRELLNNYHYLSYKQTGTSNSGKPE